MVSYGIYYALGFGAAGALITWLLSWPFAIPFYLLAAFCLNFFRDPERVIPAGPYAVSPADGKVVAIKPDDAGGLRISIFLNVFDVHVNRSPVAGVIRGVHYQKGKFLNAMNPASAESNEQNTVSVDAAGHGIIFKQIAGLLARRIVFIKKIGDTVQRGERVGLIKFGSRTDVLLEPSARIEVKVGDRVKGGSSILAFLTAKPEELAGTAAGRAREERADGQ